MPVKLARYFEFGEFRLEPEKMRLWRKDVVVRLTPKAMKILLLLVENQGRTVSREQLLEAVWKDTFIEEGNINFNISLLRKSLAHNSSEKNQFIKTVPKEGYRFVADVREIIAEDGAGETIETEIVREGSLKSAVLRLKESENLTRSRVRWHFIAIVLLGVLFVTSFGLWWQVNGEKGFSGTTPTSRNIRSVAVLPLKNLGESETGKMFSMALTDNLISRLGSLKRFPVRALSTVEKFEASGKDALKFGEELKVDAVLEGTIQQSEGRLRVNLRLLDVRDGAQIWTDNFDEQESNIFRLQDLISRRVSESLASDMNAAEKETLIKDPTENVEAYKFYLKGRELWNKRDAGITKSIFYFEKAIELDNEFALAYVGLADAQAMRAEPSLAEETLRKAIVLDADLAEPHATLGFIRMFHHFDWTTAESELKKAIELDPNYATAHHWLGVYYSIHGRLDEAKAEMLRAHELDPTSPIILTDLGQLFYFSHDYDRAVEFCGKSIELAPESAWNYGHLTAIYSKQGKKKEAFDAFLKWWERISPDPARSARELENARIKTTADFWQWSLNERKKHPDAPNACEDLFKFNLWLGNKEEALKWSDCAFEKSSRFTTAYFGVDPLYDDLRAEPRFQTILQKMNLR